MAEIVVAAVASAGAAVGGTAGAFLIMNAGAVASAALVASSLVVGNHQRRKAKAKAVAAYNAGLEDRLVAAPTTMGARSRCYGRVRNVDGVLFRATRGTNKEFYTLFIAVAGHEIDAFETIYFDETPVTLDGGGYVLTAPWAGSSRISSSSSATLNGSGTVTLNVQYIAGTSSAAYITGNEDVPLATSEGVGGITVSGGPPGQVVQINWQQSVSNSKARVRFFTGAAGQNVGAVLAADFPGLITATDHRFAGIAGLLVDLEYDPDVFPGGPPNISAVFRGARVFDPRTSTTAWTQNPALIARDWALYAYGGACASGDLVAASFSTAANVCDTTTTITLPTGSTTMPAFTCGMVAKLGEDDPWQVFLEIVESMAGKAGWPGGQLRVVAGSYRSPVTTITEDWLSGKDDIQIVPEGPTDEAVNIYRAQIADSAQRYNALQAPEVRAATYITADGRELPREVTLGGVTDTSHAQHVCSILLRDARNALTVVLPCNLRAFQVELFDVLTITLPRYGWSGKTFEVIDWRFSLSGGVVLTLKETDAAIYTPDSSFALLDLTPNTQLPNPFSVPTIGALTVTSTASTLQDGTPQTRVQVSWAAPADRAVTSSGSVELQYWPATSAVPSGDWLTAPAIPGNSTTTTVAGLRAGTVYLLRARFVNAVGIRGLWGVQAVHQVAEPVAPGFDNDYQIIGQNLLPESDQMVAPKFVRDYSPNGAAWDQGVRLVDGAAGFTTADFVLQGGRSKLVFVRQVGTHTGTTNPLQDGAGRTIAGAMRFDVDIPVTPGTRIAASAYGNGHRCRWRVWLQFFNAAGAQVGSDLFGQMVAEDGNLTNVLENLDRSEVLATVPAGASVARLWVIKFNTITSTDSYLFFGLPQIEVLAASTLLASPYSSGPVAAIGTEQITAQSASMVAHQTAMTPIFLGSWPTFTTSFDITSAVLSVTWTNNIGTRPVDVDVIVTCSNMAVQYAGSYSTVTQASLAMNVSVSSGGGAFAELIVPFAPPLEDTRVSSAGQYTATVPAGENVQLVVLARHANTTSASRLVGQFTARMVVRKL